MWSLSGRRTSSSSPSTLSLSSFCGESYRDDVGSTAANLRNPGPYHHYLLLVKGRRKSPSLSLSLSLSISSFCRMTCSQEERPPAKRSSLICQDSVLHRLRWAMFECVLRRVLTRPAVMALYHQFLPNSTQVLTKTTVADEHLCYSEEKFASLSAHWSRQGRTASKTQILVSSGLSSRLHFHSWKGSEACGRQPRGSRCPLPPSLMALTLA